MAPPDPGFASPNADADQATLAPDSPGPGAGDAPPAAPAALSAPPSLATLLHAFRRRWKVAIPVALLGAALAVAAVWFLVPGEYASVIVFRILSRPPQGSLENEDNFANVQKAHVAMMKGYEVLAEAIANSRSAELHGATFTPRQLQKRLSASFNDGPEVCAVQLTGDNPEALAAVLNALGEVYPKKVAADDEARVRNRIAQLRRRLFVEAGKDAGRQPSLAEQLRDARIALAEAEKKAGLYDTEALNRKYNDAVVNMQAAQAEARNNRLARAGLEAELAGKTRRLEKPSLPAVSDGEAEDSLRVDPEYADLMKEVSVCKKKIDDVRRLARPEARRKLLWGLEDTLGKLEARRSDLIEEARRKLARKLSAQSAEQEKKAIVELRDKIEYRKKQEVALDAEVRRWSVLAETYRTGGPKAPPEVEALRDQVKQWEKEMASVGDELARLEGSLPLHPRVVRQDEAFVPTEKEYSRTIKYGLAAGFGAFGLLLAGVCLLEARGRRVYASGDVTQGLGMRVVGTLPSLPSAARRKAALGAGLGGKGEAPSLGGLDGQFALIEAVDALRTVLLHSTRSARPGDVPGARVVLVSSAVGGEGKTTLASHLAASLSRAWRKTLLIDGDLRNPEQHLVFEQPLEPGLSEALRAEVEFEDAVKPTPISRLWLMPAGKVDAHALQALAQDGVSGFFDRLKDQYDFLVVDTSPVLPVPDALLLGQQADAVVLSVLRDVSRLPAVYQAQQRLDALGIRLLGAVVIGEETETYGRAGPYPRPEA
jgi:capsular exopolysaccharide synthesis family protein